MNSSRISLPFICLGLALFGSWKNFVFGDETSAWTVFQYEGLDDLYRQAQSEVAPGYSMVKEVCTTVMGMDSFKSIAGENNFRSDIRGTITKRENVPPDVIGFGYRRYNFKIINSNSVSLLDLYSCTSRADGTKTIALSCGYEGDHLFFIFAYDSNTKEVELRGFLMQKVISSLMDIEKLYKARRETYYHNLSQKNPEKVNQDDLQDDPVCSLSEVDKLRLCALLMNAMHYTKRYTFSVSPSNVDFECKKVFLYISTFEKPKHTLYAYRCMVNKISNPVVQVPVHVSRSYTSWQVNTYKTKRKTKDKVDIVRLKKIYRDVFFIQEPYVGEGSGSVSYKAGDESRVIVGEASSSRMDSSSAADNITEVVIPAIYTDENEIEISDEISETVDVQKNSTDKDAREISEDVTETVHVPRNSTHKDRREIL